MSRPSNPYAIVIKNIFFKDGLTEQDLYEYWIKKKSLILSELENEKAIFYIANDKGEIIVRRNQTKDELITLNPLNYEKLINGRLVGILRVMDNTSNFGIIDIDTMISTSFISPAADFEDVKGVAGDVFDYFQRLFQCKIFFTGKNGFHIRCNFSTRMPITKIKSVLENHIKESPLRVLFQRRGQYAPNLDLSPNKQNGGFIIPHSLNKIGLPCTEIQRDKLSAFKRESLIKEVKT